MRLLGQGEMHLRVAVERLAVALRRRRRDRQARRSAIARRSAATAARARPAQEADRRPRPVRRRGDRGRAAAARRGLRVRRTRSPAASCRASTSRRSRPACATACKRGPLGFPVVDVARDADRRLLPHGRFLRHGLPGGGAGSPWPRRCRKAQPVLLEPVLVGRDRHPDRGDCRRRRLVTARRGQILGYDARPGWHGWDVLNAMIPEVGDRRPDRRAALGDGRRRHLLDAVRPHGRTQRQARPRWCSRRRARRINGAVCRRLRRREPAVRSLRRTRSLATPLRSLQAPERCSERIHASGALRRNHLPVRQAAATPSRQVSSFRSEAIHDHRPRHAVPARS